jgi:hypothetical protein
MDFILNKYKRKQKNNKKVQNHKNKKKMSKNSEIIKMTMALAEELCFFNCFGCLELSMDHTCTTYPDEFKYHALGQLLAQGLISQDDYDTVYNYL